VLESTRKKEQDVKRETTEQLDQFRKQQEEADRAVLEEGGEVDDTKAEVKAGSPEAGEGQWAVNARKRKRVKEKEGLKGIKLRKSSSTNEAPVKSSEEFPEPGKGNAPALFQTRLDEKRAETPISTPPAPLAITNPKTTPAVVKAESPKASSGTGLGLAGYSSEED